MKVVGPFSCMTLFNQSQQSILALGANILKCRVKYVKALTWSGITKMIELSKRNRRGMYGSVSGDIISFELNCLYEFPMASRMVNAAILRT